MGIQSISFASFKVATGGGGGGIPTYVAAIPIGAATATTAVTVGTMPAHNADDLGLCLVWARDANALTFSANQSWVKVGSEWQQSATASELEPITFALFKKEGLSGSETSPTFTASESVTSIYASGVIYRGDSGAIEVSVVGTPASGSSDPLTITGITTTAANSLVVACYAHSDNAGFNVVHSGASLTWTEDNYQETTTGEDGCISFGSAGKASAGAMSGNVTSDLNGTFTANKIAGGVLVALSH